MSDKVYQIITDRILDALNAGTVPWQKTWTCLGEFPRNLKSKKAYRGMNVILLSLAGRSTPWWLTYKQAQDLGGQVRPGEKSTQVVFWKFLDVEQDDGSKKRVPFLRYFNVFNADQCDLPAGVVPERKGPSGEFLPVAAAEQIVANMPKRPEIQHGGDRACYSCELDIVKMPRPEQFKKPEHYYSTLFHELGHATGHLSRLGRDTVCDAQPFGTPSYSFEELVAELTAAFVCGVVGIVNETIDESASYVAGWLRKLASDPKLIVKAAGKAQKAADFILGNEPEIYSDTEEKPAVAEPAVA